MQFSTQSNPQQNPYYQRTGTEPGMPPTPEQQPETFAQRQMRLYGQPQRTPATGGGTPAAQPAATGSFAGGSPVQSNGRIAPSPTATTYTPQMAPETYQASQFSQYQGPQTQPIQQSANGLLWDLLQNPQTLGPEAVAQMQNQQKEAALRMQQQTLGQLGDSYAARGIQGGQLGGAERRVMEDTQNAILGSNRDLALKALTQNRQDELNALAAAEQGLTGQTQREIANYGALLQGQQAQAGENQWAGNYGLQAAQQNNAALSNAANLALQNQLAEEQKRQYNLGYGLDALRYMEGQRQFNDSSAQGWSNLNRLSQSDLFRMLFPNGIGY